MESYTRTEIRQLASPLAMKQHGRSPQDVLRALATNQAASASKKEGRGLHIFHLQLCHLGAETLLDLRKAIWCLDGDNCHHAPSLFSLPGPTKWQLEMTLLGRLYSTAQHMRK